MKINKTNKFIEVIGHYDNEIECAKMTLLAELYAIEHRDGYAKFPIEVEDKLQLVNDKLEFKSYSWRINVNGTRTLIASVADTIDGIFSNVIAAATTTDFSISSGKVLYQGNRLQYNGVDVLGSDTIHEDNYYTTVQLSRITCDLTTLSEWNNLSEGNHTITVKAKASGYRDSEASNSVTVTKATAGGYDFANDSWAVIAEYIKAGTDHYSLGDTKTDTITIGGNSYTATFKIVDNLVGRYATQSGQSHKVIEIQQIFGKTANGGVAWNSSGSGTSFANSSLNSDLNSTLINFLPSELRAVLETTTTYSGNGMATASASKNVAATGKLFVASFNEYYGSSATYGCANNTETNGKGQYTWYQQRGVTTSNYADLIKYQVENTSTAYYYWTRSPYASSSSACRAVRVYHDGSYSYGTVDYGSGRVAPCFAW